MLQAAIETYNKNKTIEMRNVVIELALPLVKQMAKQTRNLYHPKMEFDDVVSDGMVCLVDCVERFDTNKGISFEAYAYSRLKNNLIDQLRKLDFAPRRIRQMAKLIQNAHNTLANELMMEPSDMQIAQYLQVDVEVIHQHYQEYASCSISSIDEMMEIQGDHISADEVTDPQFIFATNENKQQLIRAIKQLKPKQQLVLSLYYYEHLKLKEIADILECSEARVSQIHASAIKQLKTIIVEEIL